MKLTPRCRHHLFFFDKKLSAIFFFSNYSDILKVSFEEEGTKTRCYLNLSLMKNFATFLLLKNSIAICKERGVVENTHQEM